MSRNGYLLFMLAFMVGMSAFVSFVVGTLPRKFPHWTNIPNRDYWLAPERREDSARFLSAHGKRLAYLVVMLMLGIHYMVLLASHRRPPALPAREFTAIIVGFGLALLWWIARLYRRFPSKDGTV
jgi:serine/threonine-protein kinase